VLVGKPPGPHPPPGGSSPFLQPVVYGRFVWSEPAEALGQEVVQLPRGAVARGQRLVERGVARARDLGLDAEAWHTPQGMDRSLAGHRGPAGTLGHPVIVVDTMDKQPPLPMSALESIQVGRCGWSGRGVYRMLAVRADPRDGELNHPVWRHFHPRTFHALFLYNTVPELAQVYRQAADLVAHSATSYMPIPRNAARRILIPFSPKSI